MNIVRKTAFELLKKSDACATYSNIAIDRALNNIELSAKDAGLLTAVVMGVTEWRLTLDHIIDSLANDPSKIEPDIRILLRMGIYQSAFLDRIPDYAAVNETVELAPKRSRGFVNAVLRSFLRKKEGDGLESFFPSDDRLKYLSVKYSFPTELCRRFENIYGSERTERILAFFNEPPRLTLRVNTLKTTREHYAAILDEKGIRYELSDRLKSSIMLDGVGFNELPKADDGLFFVQDEASQMCVEALGAECGELVVDTCSCPGSKSFGIAMNMNDLGKIFSFDLHKSKLGLVENGAKRLGINIINAAVRDGRDPDRGLFGKADRVLCDVPCSGLGVISKKPEIRYKNMADMSRLPDIQYAILESSANYVRDGGHLVYSTCTVLPEENEMNVERFLREHSDFEAVDFSVGGKSSAGGMLSLSPDTDCCDGFFIAKIRRKQDGRGI